MEKVNYSVYVYCGIMIAILLVVVGSLIIYCLKNEIKRNSHNKSYAKIKEYTNFIRTNICELRLLPEPYFSMNKNEEKVLYNELQKILNDVEESEKHKIVALCEYFGFIDKDIRLLKSGFNWKKLESIKRLGDMRIEKVVPKLYEILKKEKSNMSIYIISSSIIKARRCNEDILNVLKFIIKRNCSREVIVDMIRNDISINKKGLFIRLYNDFNKELLKIGMGIIDINTASEVEPYLYNILVHESNPELKILSMKILYESNNNLLLKNIYDLLNNDSEKVRKLAAKYCRELYTFNWRRNNFEDSILNTYADNYYETVRLDQIV